MKPMKNTCRVLNVKGVRVNLTNVAFYEPVDSQMCEIHGISFYMIGGCVKTVSFGKDNYDRNKVLEKLDAVQNVDVT